jgi:hypothetical protein
MNYLYKNERDSALWAFREGKKRGGFGKFYLDALRSMLKFCNEEAMIITAGDNFTIPLWYLQTVENYRPDLIIIDVSLLNTIWYPQYLSRTTKIRFDLSSTDLDSLEYCEWKKQVVSIGDFTWELKPSYYEQLLLRGDRVLLSIFRADKFNRETYFTIGFYEDSRLSLQDYMLSYYVIDKLDLTRNADFNPEDYKVLLTNTMKTATALNRNSSDELNFLEIIRYSLFKKVEYYLSKERLTEARELYGNIEAYLNESKFPYPNEETKIYIKSIREKLW